MQLGGGIRRVELLDDAGFTLGIDLEGAGELLMRDDELFLAVAIEIAGGERSGGDFAHKRVRDALDALEGGFCIARAEQKLHGAEIGEQGEVSTTILIRINHAQAVDAAGFDGELLCGGQEAFAGTGLAQCDELWLRFDLAHAKNARVWQRQERTGGQREQCLAFLGLINDLGINEAVVLPMGNADGLFAGAEQHEIRLLIDIHVGNGERLDAAEDRKLTTVAEGTAGTALKQPRTRGFRLGHDDIGVTVASEVAIGHGAGLRIGRRHGVADGGGTIRVGFGHATREFGNLHHICLLLNPSEAGLLATKADGV